MINTRKLNDINIADLCISIFDRSTGSAVEELYLQTKHRVAWFNKWCEENGKAGCIDDSELELVGTPPHAFWVCKASVSIDGQIVAKSAAAAAWGDADGDWTAPQLAGTYAKGRALSNAGFGTASCGIEDGGNAEAKGYLADAPVAKPETDNPVNNPHDDADPDNPLLSVDSPIQPNEPPQPEKSLEEPQTQAEGNGKREDAYSRALKVVVPFGGYSGKTLGEIIVTNKSYPEWLLSHVKETDEARKKLLAAAKYIIEHRPK